ncbi:MAG: hypothetical protein MUO31_05490 [Thermodesulfovibrionales bacterium]|nr:hypothetical protein [Thermodesulfovibrionales bacterium]
MDKLTHDDQYKRYLKATIGPNTLPIVKITLSAFVIFLFAIIITLNMFIVTRPTPTSPAAPAQPIAPSAPVVVFY